MHVQLADHIAQGRDVHLVGTEGVLEGFGKEGRFLPELPLLLRTELEQLTDFLAARHQDEPGVLGIVHQQQPAQGEITDWQGVLLKSWVQGEHTGLSCSTVGNSRLTPASGTRPRRAGRAA
ncbi:hypothetical protein D3C78_1448390 [compost metagenome]